MMSLPTHAAGQSIPANLPLGRSPDHVARGVARVVGSIIAYTRWPARPNVVRLCVVAPAQYARGLGESPMPSGGPEIWRSDVTVAGTATLGNDCDVVYLGQLSFPVMRRITAALRGRAVLTIAEADPQCSSEAMFCLVFEPASLSFRMNVDAISRSGVKIDPRVLRVAREN